MNGWQATTLGEVCSLITDGKHGDCTNEESSGYYFISAKDIRDGIINYENVRQIAESDFAETHRRTDLHPGDLLVTNSGTIGRLAIAHDNERTHKTTFQKSVAILKPKPCGISSRFLYYYLAANMKAFIHSAAGAAQKNLLLRDIRAFRIYKPSLHEQDNISGILSNYDYLTKNNQRRIALLEEAARLLYREWFVHFRFPGHKHVEITKGLPNGWGRQTLGAVCQAVGGGTPSTSKREYWSDGDIPWYTPTDITRNSCLSLLDSEKKITEAGLRGSSAKMLPTGTVLMTSRASVGFFGIVEEPSCTNQGFISILPNDVHARMYLLFNLMHRVEQIRSHAGGATYKEINKAKFKALNVVMPDSALLREFEEQTSGLHAQVRTLHTMNQKLARARDLLLPRLMSGEIAV